MKLVMDEKLKHRLIGLAVVISLAAIFVPAAMRKSSQRLEHNYSVNIKLPPKPVAPNVAVNDEKDVFKTIKIARVNIPAVSTESQLPELTKAKSIESERTTVQLAQIEPQIKTIEIDSKTTARQPAPQIVQHPAPVVMKQVVPVKRQKIINSRPVVKTNVKPAHKKDVYSVQLASLSQHSNAQSLVNRLKAKGYKAYFVKMSGRQGAVYKVYAGQSPVKNDAVKLKTQLATAMRLNGFVVNTGVS